MSILTDFDSGRLPELEIQRVSEHLAVCQVCSEQLDNISAANDSWADLFQFVERRTDYDAFLQESQVKLVLERIAEQTVQENLGEISTSKNPKASSDEPGAADSWRPGDLFGPYQLVRELGRGGMGAVYLAQHQKLNRLVAVKFTKVAGNRDEASLARFEREMQAIGQVQHPNVVVAHDAGQIDGTHFIAMEYVDGETLAARQRRDGTLAVGDACDVVRQAAIGLQHAHDQGLIHRDIKPGNLMIDRQGVVKVLDLGLARMDPRSSQAVANDLHSHDELTRSGTALGTVGYMSPEQVMDSGSIDSRTDIYSLGVTLYRCLTGRMPLPDSTYRHFARFVVAITRDDPISIRELRPDLPGDLASLVEAMMARDPEQRIQTAREVADRLAQIPSTPGNTDRDVASQASRARTSWSPRTWASLIAIGSLVAWLGVLQVFRVSTPNGELLVEIADDETAARLTSEGIVVVDERNDRSWNINATSKGPQLLPAGQYRFEAPAGLLITDESGLEIRSDELKLLDRDKQLRIRVSLGMQTRSTTPIDQQSTSVEPNADGSDGDSLFDLIDGLGGRIQFQSAKQQGWKAASSQDDLDTELAFLHIEVSGSKQFGDLELKRVADSLKMMPLGRCNLVWTMRGTPISENGLLHLRGLSLSMLEISNTTPDLSRLGEQIEELVVEDWRLGSKATSAENIRAVSRVRSIKRIGVILNSDGMSESDVTGIIETLVRSPALSLRIDSRGVDLSKSQLGLLSKTKAPELILREFSRLSAEHLAEIERLQPITTVIHPSATFPRQPCQGLQSDSGFQFMGCVSAAESVPNEFVLEFDAQRTSLRHQGLGIVFRIGETFARVVLGGWEGTVSAIESINGLPGDDPRNPTKITLDPFEDGKKHRIRIVVTTRSIGAQIDGKTRLWWHGDAATINAARSEQDMRFGDAFLVSRGGSNYHGDPSYRVSNLNITPLIDTEDYPRRHPERHDIDREVARWADSLGAWVSGPQGPYKKQQFDRSDLDLLYINFPNVTDQETFSDLSRLAKLPSLRQLRFDGSKLDSRGLLSFRDVPFLQWLSLRATKTSTSEFVGVENLRHLSALEFDGSQVDDAWEVLKTFESLRQVILWDYAIPKLDRLGDFPNLNRLSLVQLTPSEDVIERIQRANPRLQIFTWQDGKAFVCLGDDPVRKAVPDLVSRGWRIRGSFPHPPKVWVNEEIPESAQPAEVFELRSPRNVALTDSDYADLHTVVRDLLLLEFASGVSGLERLPEFMRGRIVKELILDGATFDDGLLRKLSQNSVLQQLSVKNTQVTRTGVVAFKQAQPTCHIDSDFGVFPTEHCLPGQADAIPLHEQATWQRARELVESYGGVIRVGPYGSDLMLDEHLQTIPNGVTVHLNFRDCKNFTDSGAYEVAKILENLPNFYCGPLVLKGTSVTHEGLLAFEALQPAHIILGDSPVSMNVDSVARRLATWPTHDFNFEDAIGEQGLAEFVAESHATSIVVSTARLSPSAIKAISQSKSTDVTVRFEEEKIDAYVPVMKTWTNVKVLRLRDCPRPTDQQVRELQSALPSTRIWWDLKLMTPRGI
ncbi:MAG: serine/threonine-protein kinase [Planctomycetota bacterium]